jgi:mono/diheme cytochrome c family protein
MKKILIASLPILFLGLVVLSSIFAASESSDKGKDLYNNNCQICHGMKGDGKGQAAPALNPKPTDFTKPSFWKSDSEKEITESVTKGHGIMQPVLLKPNEIKAVIAYMTQAFKK